MVIYLLLYYRGLAIVAVSSLVIAGLLAYLSVVLLGKYQGFALSLAGIAGLIVAIGITADSFVVFFERLRDEVREGRSLRAAVERGWGRARRTILVSDTVSFLAAALLYYFAIGSVRGFAFTLGLTTIIDVVVVFTFTQPDDDAAGPDQVLRRRAPPVRPRPRPARGPRALAGNPAPLGGPGPGPADPGEGGVMSALGGIGGRLYRGEVSVEFVGRQRLWYTISGVILAVSIIALVVFGLNFSVDFKGGSVFQFPAGTATISQVRTVVSGPAAAATPSSSTSRTPRITPPAGPCRPIS